MKKPLAAAQQLQIVTQQIAAGQPLAPSLRHWLCAAFRARLADPSRTIDQLLGVASRAGGRLHAASRLPELHRAINELAQGEEPPSRRAETLAARIQNHRLIPEPGLTEIERQCGRMPGTARQLRKILSGQTEALRQADDGNLKLLGTAPAPWCAIIQE